MTLDDFAKVKKRHVIHVDAYAQLCKDCDALVKVEEHPNGIVTVHCRLRQCGKLRPPKNRKTQFDEGDDPTLHSVGEDAF